MVCSESRCYNNYFKGILRHVYKAGINISSNKHVNILVLIYFFCLLNQHIDNIRVH